MSVKIVEENWLKIQAVKFAAKNKRLLIEWVINKGFRVHEFRTDFLFRILVSKSQGRQLEDEVKKMGFVKSTRW